MRFAWNVAAAVFVAIAAFAPAAASADSVRCAGGIVATGATPATVEQKCGAPTHAEHRDEVGVVRGYSIHTITDVWTYDLGPRRFVQTMTFVDGVLQTIALGGYGTPGH